MHLSGQIRKRGVSLIIFTLAGLLFLNQAFSQPAPLKIGISKASPNYVNWLKRAYPSIQTIDLYTLPIGDAVQQLMQCSGLLLTGGEDVWPGRYGKEYDTLRCTGMNPHRDSLDMALIKQALAQKMPVVGICRGHQILNVYLGGTLIVDIPADFGKRIIHQCDDYLSCFHGIGVRKATLLETITGCDSARVTTNHHQAVDRLSPMLASNAYSNDRLIEGIEWQDPAGKSFLLGVQWHPERMELPNPLSGPIAMEFIRQSVTYSIKNQTNQNK
jgi:putative glutamine amidotransferase